MIGSAEVSNPYHGAIALGVCQKVVCQEVEHDIGAVL